MNSKTSWKFLWLAVGLLCWWWAAGSESASAQQQVSRSEIRQAMSRARQYLEAQNEKMYGPSRSLAAYAFLVAGGKHNSPLVARAIHDVENKIQNGKYKPEAHHIYEAAVDLMLLEEYDKSKYKSQMEAIARYLVGQQAPEGYWEYPHRHVGGDTSITQYGTLGLWSAARSGIHIPLRVWEKAAQWLMRTQLQSGAFAYWPVGSAKERARPEPRHSMTAAGVSALLICRLYLAGGEEWTPQQRQKKKRSGGVLGVLQKGESEEQQPSQKKQTDILADEEGYQPKLKPKQLDPAIQRGLAWLGANFNLQNPVGEPFYYLYTMERSGALAHTDYYGPHNWYAEGAAYALKIQREDGSWHANWVAEITAPIDTSFVLLFLAKSTAKHVKHVVPEGFGGGLLSGGRGLPDDLSQAVVRDGAIVAEKVETPLDKLLADLADPKNYDVTEAQQQLVREVQLGNREELIGKKDLLLKLAQDPRVEVRRTAMWALGRCEDIRLARVLIQGLQDPNFDVAVEAYNALCTLSRRPQGLGPAPPTGKNGTPPDQAAIEKWRKEAVKAWTKWYLKVRPYDERDDLFLDMAQ